MSFFYSAVPHLDAAENVFFKRQLEEIAAESFDPKYAKLIGRMMLPTKSLSAGAETYTYRSFDKRAKAAPMVDMGDDLPLVNAVGTEYTFALRSFGLAFHYTRDEIQAAAKGGFALERERASACRDGLAQYLDDVCLSGDSTFGLKGLTNLSSTNTYSVPADGTGSSKAFADKTPAQILRDMNALVSTVKVATKDIESPTRIVLPIAAYEHISATARSDNSDVSILNYFKMNRPGVEVMSWEKLSTAGSGGVSRAVAYDPKASNLHLLMAIEYEQLAPQERNFNYIVNARLKTGGVVSPYPKSILYADGV